MPKRFWTTLEGKQIAISDMDLGHLANTIRMIAEKLEQARASGQKRTIDRFEGDLFALQAEFDSRDKEIEQIQGIGRALGLK